MSSSFSKKRVQRLVAEGFEERLRIRRQKQQERREHAKVYKARKKAESLDEQHRRDVQYMIGRAYYLLADPAATKREIAWARECLKAWPQEAALADQRNSAFPSSPAVDRGKLPTYKQAVGGKP